LVDWRSTFCFVFEEAAVTGMKKGMIVVAKHNHNPAPSTSHSAELAAAASVSGGGGAGHTIFKTFCQNAVPSIRTAAIRLRLDASSSSSSSSSDTESSQNHHSFITASSA
jgi:hypothetical protein